VLTKIQVLTRIQVLITTKIHGGSTYASHVTDRALWKSKSTKGGWR
jgi:hypothetical protein